MRGPYLRPLQKNWSLTAMADDLDKLLDETLEQFQRAEAAPPSASQAPGHSSASAGTKPKGFDPLGKKKAKGWC